MGELEEAGENRHRRANSLGGGDHLPKPYLGDWEQFLSRQDISRGRLILRAVRYKTLLKRVLECNEHGFTLDSELLQDIKTAVEKRN